MAYWTLINWVDVKLSCSNVECGPHQTLPPYSRLRGHWGRGYLSGLSVTSVRYFAEGKMFWSNFFPSLVLPYLLLKMDDYDEKPRLLRRAREWITQPWSLILRPFKKAAGFWLVAFPMYLLGTTVKVSLIFFSKSVSQFGNVLIVSQILIIDETLSHHEWLRKQK